MSVPVPSQLPRGFTYLLSYTEFVQIFDSEERHVFVRNETPDAVDVAIEREGKVLELGMHRHTGRKAVTAVEDFLIEFINRPDHFWGNPDYSRGTMTKETFDLCYEAGVEILKTRRAKAAEKQGPLVKLFRLLGLNPSAHGGDEDSWYANCPSGRSHRAMVTNSTNEWGCGYCQRKGSWADLVEWSIEVKGKTASKQ